jgi:hypothetical protein
MGLTNLGFDKTRELLEQQRPFMLCIHYVNVRKGKVALELNEAPTINTLG